MKRLIRFSIVLIVPLLLATCAHQPSRPVSKPLAVTQASVDSSYRTIQSVSQHLVGLDQEFATLPHPAREGRDYFTATEVDAIESLLFRFLAVQTSLWDIVNAYGGLDAVFPTDELDTRAQALAITATLLMASHTAYIVDEFADEPLAIRQMNEVYYRSDIPFGTYDRMRENVTSPGVLTAVTDAGRLYAEEMADPGSPMASLASSDPVYAKLIRQIPQLQATAENRLQQVAANDPSYRQAESEARKDEKKQHKTLYALRSFLFKEVSRLKEPTAHVVVFTKEQKEQIFKALQPGDIILTYTAGYMSDVFIPGAFKHGITYVGSPESRANMNLSPDVLPANERFEPKVLSANLEVVSLPDGKKADMIEAVAEGVIFNDLEHIMDTHVNRMLVLRPNLSDAERAAFVVEVFSYLGDGYDFRFDFADATYQVCTEVIYRAINSKGTIDFTLTERAGHETLSADDVANYHLNANTEAFDFVLLVETDPQSKDHGALVFTGPEGEKRLETLMRENAPKAK